MKTGMQAAGNDQNWSSVDTRFPQAPRPAPLFDRSGLRPRAQKRQDLVPLARRRQWSSQGVTPKHLTMARPHAAAAGRRRPAARPTFRPEQATSPKVTKTIAAYGQLDEMALLLSTLDERREERLLKPFSRHAAFDKFWIRDDASQE